MGVVQYNVVANDWVNLEFIINDLTVRVVGQQVNPTSTPTFAGGNITGDLGVGGDVDITGNLSLSGGLELPGLDAGGICFIDSDDEIDTDSGLTWDNTLKVQAITGTLIVSNKIGVGTTDPQEEIHVITKDAKIRIDSDTTDGFASLQALNKDADAIEITSFDRVMAINQKFGISASGMCMLRAAPNAVMAIGTANAKDLFFATNNVERLRIASDGAISTIGTFSVGSITGTSLKILESGATPTLYGIFAVPNLTGLNNITYTFPAADGYIPYSSSGTYVKIDYYINQTVLTSSSPSFVAISTSAGNIESAADVIVGAGSSYSWSTDLATKIKRDATGTIQIVCGNTEVAEFDVVSIDFTSPLYLPKNGLYIKENVGSPVYSALFYVPDLAADISYTFPAVTATIASVANLAAYQPVDAGLTDIAGLATTNSNFIVGNDAGTNWTVESGATARTSLGLGTADTPQFAGLGIGTLGAANTAIALNAYKVLPISSGVQSLGFVGQDHDGIDRVGLWFCYFQGHLTGSPNTGTFDSQCVIGPSTTSAVRYGFDISANNSGIFSIYGNAPSIYLHHKNTTDAGVSFSFFKPYLQNTISRILAGGIGIYGDINQANPPAPIYIWFDARTTAAYNSATLKIDNANRVGIALASTTRPSCELDVGGAGLFSTTLGVTGLITATGGITLPAAANIALATTTGTKIGTATSQLLGFYNATPVDQPATVADPTGGLVTDAECRTAVIAVIDRLQELGLVA